MKTRNLSKLVQILFLGSILSCKHDNVETIGPDICGVSDNFSIIASLSISDNPVDFSSGVQTFTAEFSEEAPWKIIITGSVSGAKKILSGTNKILNTTWDGSSDTVYFFRNELVTTSLEIPCREAIPGPDFTINGTKVYSGILVSDFEGNGFVTSWTTSSQQTLQSFGIDSTLFPPQGNKYYYMKGTDDNNDYGVGMMMHSGATFGLPLDPNEVYLNIYIKGVPNSRLDLRVLEADGDQYTNVQYITWSGWKLISVKYSDFDLTSGSAINGKNPDLCTRTRFLLKSSPPGNYVEAYIDYIVFTVGAPFKS